MLLFVLLDALRHDYINRDDSPFLHTLAVEGLSGSVIPSFGFEPDAAYLAGLQPGEADGGAMFWLDPARSPFRFARFLPPALDRLPKAAARNMRRVIRLVAQLTAKERSLRRWAAPAWIPLRQLPLFAFANTRRMDEPGFVPAPSATVFDHLRSMGTKWYFHGMPDYRVNAASVHSRFLKEYQGQKYAFLHIGDLDRIGHRSGPWSFDRKAALRQIDNLLEQIIAHARSKAPQVEVMILGDHGMVQVERTLDITPIAQQLKAHGLAFDYFIDATLFRCWSGNESDLSAIREEMNRVPGLVEITRTEAQRYGLCYCHNRFWDLCWQAEAGLMFTPNFHNSSERLLGMHGYLPECPDNHSGFVMSSIRLPMHLLGQQLEAVDMRRFFFTQMALLDIVIPSSCESVV